MNQPITLQPTRLPERGPRTVLLALLLGAVLVYGAFSFAPAAHAASLAHPSSPVHAAGVVPDSGTFAQIGADSYAWSVYIQGYNQYGNLTHNCLNITATPPNASVLYNWWWNGNFGVSLTFYHSSRGYSQPYGCPNGDPGKVYQVVFFQGTNLFIAQDLS